jgi:hypothetical protein
MNQFFMRVLGSLLLEWQLIGQNTNWTEVLGTVVATIDSQHGRGKHDINEEKNLNMKI